MDICSHNSIEDGEDSEDFIDGIIDSVSDFISDDNNSDNIFKKIYIKIKNIFNTCIPNRII